MTEQDVKRVYATLASRARLEYGPAFSCLRRLWSNSSEAVGRATLPESEHDRARGFAFMHPGLLDGCLHAIAGLSPSDAAADAAAAAAADRKSVV